MIYLIPGTLYAPDTRRIGRWVAQKWEICIVSPEFCRSSGTALSGRVMARLGQRRRAPALGVRPRPAQPATPSPLSAYAGFFGSKPLSRDDSALAREAA